MIWINYLLSQILGTYYKIVIFLTLTLYSTGKQGKRNTNHQKSILRKESLHAAASLIMWLALIWLGAFFDQSPRSCLVDISRGGEPEWAMWGIWGVNPHPNYFFCEKRSWLKHFTKYYYLARHLMTKMSRDYWIRKF